MPISKINLVTLTAVFLFESLIWSDDSHALECSEKRIILKTQESIDKFLQHHGNCSEIAGNLEISGDDIENLEGLQEITSIKGDLVIWYNPVLQNLDGLSNLESVNGLAIWNNSKLENINGLSKVTGMIESDIDVSFNESLTNISALLGLREVRGSIYFEGNSSLENLSGLNNLYITDNLFVWDNEQLNSLSGLENLAKLGSSLSIINNPKLSNCSSISLLLGWPEGLSDDDLGDKITLFNNGIECNSIGSILSSAPYVGLDQIRLPTAMCKPIHTAKNTPLSQNEQGVFNLSEETVDIICPLPLKINDSFLDRKNAVSDISIKYLPQTSKHLDFECSIFEYAGSQLLRKIEGIKANDSASQTFVWDRIYSLENNLSTFSINCSLPPNSAIIAIEFEVIY